jgi:hypothetical protein
MLTRQPLAGKIFRMRMVAFCILLVVMGCKKEKPPEQTYKGKPESEWIKLSKDADVATRLAAFQALARLSTPASLEASKAGLTDEIPGIRATAAGALQYEMPDDSIRVMRQLIQLNSEGMAHMDTFFYYIMPPNSPLAKAVIPDLRASMKKWNNPEFREAIERTLRDEYAVQSSLPATSP